MTSSNFPKILISAFGALCFTFASIAMVSPVVPTRANATVQAGG